MIANVIPSISLKLKNWTYASISKKCTVISRGPNQLRLCYSLNVCQNAIKINAINGLGFYWLYEEDITKYFAKMYENTQFVTRNHGSLKANNRFGWMKYLTLTDIVMNWGSLCVMGIQIYYILHANLPNQKNNRNFFHLFYSFFSFIVHFYGNQKMLHDLNWNSMRYNEWQSKMNWNKK